MRAIRGVLWGSLALVATASLPARAEEPRAFPEAAIRRASAEFMAAKGIPGVQVAVREADGKTWSEGFGLADVENRVPVTAETHFRFASISKAVTAVAIMRLVEQGRIDLDASVRTYCPSLPRKRWTVTTRQLLAHLAGIRHYKEGDDTEYENTRFFPTIRDGLALFRDEPLLHEPGTKFYYTTFGYTVLGCVAEGVTGKDFRSFLRAEFFPVAGMTGAEVDDVRALIPSRAYGYALTTEGRLQNSTLADTSYKIPGGGLVGRALDLVALAGELLQGRIVTAETRAAMWSPQTPRTGEDSEYGLGFILDDERGLNEVFHTGSQQRVSTVLYILPDEGRAVAVMSNLEEARSLVLARRVADLLAGRASGDWLQTQAPPTAALPWYERLRN